MPRRRRLYANCQLPVELILYELRPNSPSGGYMPKRRRLYAISHYNSPMNSDLSGARYLPKCRFQVGPSKGADNKLRWVPVGKDSPPIGTSAKCKLHLRPSFDQKQLYAEKYAYDSCGSLQITINEESMLFCAKVHVETIYSFLGQIISR